MPEVFVEMYVVKGIYFKGCEFANTVPTNYYSVDQRGIGIKSGDADYLITDYCLNSSVPCNDSKPSSFLNLDYGIYSMGKDDNDNINIKNCEFTNNVSGIFLSGIKDAIVILNNFEFGTGDIILPNNSGLYLDHCDRYQVEENSFIADVKSGNMAGIVVTLKDGTISYADIDSNLLSRVISVISPEELGEMVCAIADAVENPQPKTYCKRMREKS